MQKTNPNPLALAVPFRNQLRHHHAPGEMIDWAGYKTEQEFVKECHRPDWLLWTMEKKRTHVGWPDGKRLAAAAIISVSLSWILTRMFMRKLGRLLALKVLRSYISPTEAKQ